MKPTIKPSKFDYKKIVTTLSCMIIACSLHKCVTYVHISCHMFTHDLPALILPTLLVCMCNNCNISTRNLPDMYA